MREKEFPALVYYFVHHVDIKIFLDYTRFMPVTKTAKRALRGSKRKEKANSLIVSRLGASLRMAKKIGGKKAILKAISLTDRAAKKKVVHKNKAARIKSALSRLLLKKPQQ